MTREKGGRGVEIEGQACGLCHRKQGTLRGAGTGQPVADMAGVLLPAMVAAGSVTLHAGEGRPPAHP